MCTYTGKEYLAESLKIFTQISFLGYSSLPIVVESIIQKYPRYIGKKSCQANF